MVIGASDRHRYLSAESVRRIVREGFARVAVDGQRVLVIIPDGTRTMPMPLMFDALVETLGERVAVMDFLVALGTHRPMGDAALSRLVGRPVVGERAGGRRVFNHRWSDPSTFVTVGSIPAAEIAVLTEGLFSRDVPVALNRAVVDYDHVIVCGPVFPHEVAGFSGGAKYLVPGIAGPDIIDFTHWLGALITSSRVIGMAHTPVRAVIDRAARLVDRPVTCISLVVAGEEIAGLYVGSLSDAWHAAAQLSSHLHVTYLERPVGKVLSVMPAMYQDLWTAGKGMYKVEPIVADGGEVIIFAPHITEVSHTHGKLIDQIGYHCRDYFVSQRERFERYPGSVLAHSTHVKGLGSYDPLTGIETPRVTVTLATAIPRARCERVNLKYRDPAAIRLDEWEREQAGRDGDVLVVHRAGEMLYRMATPAAVAERSA
jgi:lactate racemase